MMQSCSCVLVFGLFSCCRKCQDLTVGTQRIELTTGPCSSLNYDAKEPCSHKELSILLQRIKPKLGRICGTGFMYLEWTVLSTGGVENLEYKISPVYAKTISKTGVKKWWPLVSTAVNLQTLNEFRRMSIWPVTPLLQNRTRTGLIKLDIFTDKNFSFDRRAWKLAFNICSSFLTFYTWAPGTYKW